MSLSSLEAMDCPALRKKDNRLEWFVVSLMGAVILYQLMIPPVVGLADNGDFHRLMSKVGLDSADAPYEDEHYTFINPKYKITWNIPDWGYKTSAFFFVKGAVLANKFISKDGLFDIRILGLFYTTAFLFSVWVILFATKEMRAWQRYLLALLVVLMFTDVGYISYFNSFYGEPASFVFLFLLVGALLVFAKDGHASLWHIGVIAALMLLFITAKAQNTPMGFFIGLGLALFALQWKHKLRIVVALSLVLTFSVTSLFFIMKNPQTGRIANLYNVIFNSILKHSPSPQNDMRELRLDSSLLKYIDTNVWQNTTPIYDSDFRASFSHIGYAAVMKFYLNHPDRALALAKRCVHDAFCIRPSYLGNFDESSGFPPRHKSKAFSSWSYFKEAVSPKSLWFLLGFIAFNIGIVAVEMLKRSSRKPVQTLNIELFGVLIAMMVLQFTIALLGEAEVDLVKHLFLFNVLLDLCIIIDILWVTSKLSAPIAWIKQRVLPSSACVHYHN